MTKLLNSYTFEAKKIVYYSVTVGANSKAEAKSEDEAIALVNEDINAHEIVYEEVKEWQVDHAEEIV